MPLCPPIPGFGDAQSRERNASALSDEIAAIISADTRQLWIERFANTNISAIENIAIQDFHADPHVRKAGLVVCREHPGMGMADHLGIVPRLSGTPARVGRPTPVLGAETDEILAEAGYTATEIATLKAAGTVVQHIG